MYKHANITTKNTIGRKNRIALFLACSVMVLPVLAYAQDGNLDGLPDLSAAEVQKGETVDIDNVLQDIDNTIGSDAPPNVAMDAVQDVTPVAEPEKAELADPELANTKAAVEQAGEMPDIPSIKAEDAPEDNLFFDAESLVPQGELAGKGAPRKVSPVTEPGSRLIVVKKDYGANSQKAALVAAERAMKLGRYAAAVDMYDAMYAKNKRDPNVLMGRAEAYQRLGQDDFAVQAYEELLKIRPKNLEARINMLGIIGQKYPSVALRQLLDLRDDGNSNSVGIVAQVAVMEAKLEQYDDAIRYLGIAASMEPQNPSHIFNMAVITDTAGNKKQAIKYYEQALEVDTLYGKGEQIPRDAIFERLAGLR